MTLEEQIAKSFSLEGDSWKKHANPWSVWTRFATLPFLILAIWSRVWIGWYSLIPTLIIIIWLKFNPILFKEPKEFTNWSSKSVLGEKFWSERKKKPVPHHHQVMIIVLSILQSIGAITLLIGLWQLNIYLTVIGTIMVYFAKMWFLDRMIWIYEDMTR